MKQQEYMVISEIENLKPKDLQLIFNTKGKQGWKYTGNYNSWLIFMRDSLSEEETIREAESWLQKNQSKFETSRR